MSLVDVCVPADAPATASGSDGPCRRPARPIRVGLLGYGRVGQAVAEALLSAPSAEGPLPVCTAALVRDVTRRRSGPSVRLVTDAAAVLAGADVVVEVLGGCEPARTIVGAALDAGIPVVTANKSLVARHGAELARRAARSGTPLCIEAAVLAGVPFLGALARRPRLRAAAALTGVVNGTSHFILDTMARGACAADALAEAVSRGYAEPDASADTSGLDAAEKLAILLQLCGLGGIAVDDLVRVGIDEVTPADCAGAAFFDAVLKPVAHASASAASIETWVGPAIVPARHVLGSLAGVDNAVCLTALDGSRVSFAGPGAGPAATARTILDDIAEVAAGCAVTPLLAHASPAAPPEVRAPVGRWFVRVRGPQPARRVAEQLAAADVAVERLVVHAGCVFALTGRAEHDAIRRAVGAFNRGEASVFIAPAIS